MEATSLLQNLPLSDPITGILEFIVHANIFSLKGFFLDSVLPPPFPLTSKQSHS